MLTAAFAPVDGLFAPDDDAFALLDDPFALLDDPFSSEFRQTRPTLIESRSASSALRSASDEL